ncbi:hypothetical protein [Fuchsiella alkaliacetigena]|nr:hypothetical protein [Fuchsiella alkaliacetigena]MCK8825880.1 hypothetical protein [Fuchsiella alkaliacetigena]
MIDDRGDAELVPVVIDKVKTVKTLNFDGFELNLSSILYHLSSKEVGPI